MPGYDLHTHSTHSDGVTTIEHNVRLAIELGLDGLAVTDHDTTTQFAEAFDAADGTDLEIVPGVEFSAELDGSSVHVLGYWIDPEDGPLQDEMHRLRNERAIRAEGIVEKFNGLGVDLSIDRVRELAGDAPIGRPHIARAVLETGAVDSMQEVFDRYLADDGPAYVPKHAVDPVRAVELLVGAGGVAVVAHPGLFGARKQGEGEPGLTDATLEAMVAAGMQGIEAEHPEHTPENRDRFLAFARAHDLVVTAGSDYHGGRAERDEGRATELGEAVTEAATFHALQERRAT